MNPIAVITVFSGLTYKQGIQLGHSQPRPQGLLCFQDGGWAQRRPWDTLVKYSMNRGVFCHMTHD